MWTTATPQSYYSPVAAREKSLQGRQNAIVDGKSHSVSHVVAVANHNAKASITSSPDVLERLSRSADILSKKLANGEVIYGVTTSFGGRADTRTADYVALQKSLQQHQNAAFVLPGDRAHAASSSFVLDNLKSHAMPVNIVKAAMLVRCNSLLRGHSAVRLQVV